MNRRGIDIMTLIIVTVVTVLIWMLAAARTRQSQVLSATIEFTVPGQGNFVLSPQQDIVDIEVEGPREAVNQMRTLLSGSPLPIPITAQQGSQSIDDLATAIANNEEIRRTGAEIVSVEPAIATVTVEKVVTRQASISVEIPSASSIEGVSVAEDSVEVTLPEQELNRLPEPLTVEAIVDRREVERLEPGIMHTVAGTVRFPPKFGNFESVTFAPPTVRVSFRLISRVRTLDLEQVRVQINSAAQDFGKYRVTLPDQFLRDVSIEAEADVIDRLEKGEGQVVAVVYLSTNDKERQLETKPVAFFTALFPDGMGFPVKASINGEAHPEVELQITPLVDSPE
ncbi:MAG: hypothetical protein CMJ39_10850 [Phycisphaerae bacterium]|nr:hypothetical protein [Phycisphaerae bacterium]